MWRKIFYIIVALCRFLPLEAEELNLNECQENWGREKIHKVIGMVGPQLFYQTNRPGTEWQYTIGTSYSLSSFFINNDNVCSLFVSLG